jgi:hypothetical protein
MLRQLEVLAAREGLTSTALISPTTLANFCSYCQRHQSLATVRTFILPVMLEKQIWHVLVAMVVTLGLKIVSRRTVRKRSTLITPTPGRHWQRWRHSGDSLLGWSLPNRSSYRKNRRTSCTQRRLWRERSRGPSAERHRQLGSRAPH